MHIKPELGKEKLVCIATITSCFERVVISILPLFTIQNFAGFHFYFSVNGTKYKKTKIFWMTKNNRK